MKSFVFLVGGIEMITNVKFYHDKDVVNVMDDNIDVEVLLDNGERYTAAFFTLKNIASILERYKNSGECLSGLYFWASNLIIIDNLHKETIREAIDDLVKNGEFFSSFSRVE